MGCKVEGLTVGRRRPLVGCDRTQADRRQRAWSRQGGEDAGCWVTSCLMASFFLKDTGRRVV